MRAAGGGRVRCFCLGIFEGSWSCINPFQEVGARATTVLKKKILKYPSPSPPIKTYLP